MKHLYVTLALVLEALLSLGQWTSNTSLNLQVAGVNAADIQTVATSDGKTWIAFYSQNNGNYDMRAQLLDAGGNKLLGNNGVLVSNKPSGSATYVFNICTDAANNLIIAFQYQVNFVDNAVVTKVAANGTLPWGTAGIVLGEGLAPYPAVLATGETVVAWNNSNPSTLYMQKVTAAGVKAWTTPKSVTVGTSSTTRGQIVANPEGKFTMVFQKRSFGIYTTLYAQRYTNDGTAVWAAPQQISTYTSSGARYYSIVAEGDTTYYGYYALSGNRFYSFLQRINPDGTIPYGSNGTALSTYSTGNDPYQQTTAIAHTPGSRYVWAACTYSNTLQSEYGVFVQKFETATGNRLLNAHGKEVYAISANADMQTGDLTLIDDAPLFMSYNENYKIFATRLDTAGNFVWPGNRVELSSTTAGAGNGKGRFNFTPAGNNQAVAVWYEDRGSGYLPYAQNITAAGSTGVLPVNLAVFNAEKRDNNVNLSWKTYTENNNSGFYIEKSADGVDFTGIGFVATRAVNGSSNTVLAYSLTDTHPYGGANYYRLKQTDKDGNFTYSKIALVTFGRAGDIFITKLYPVPAIRTLQLVIQSAKATPVTYTVLDVQGKALLQKNVSLAGGENTFNISVGSLAKGTYFLKITGPGQQEKIVQQWMKQ